MNIRILFGISLTLLGMLMTTPSNAYTVPDSVVQKVIKYYDINKNKSPVYGCNWFRVLLAYEEKTKSDWPRQGTTCNLEPYTAAEAKASEAIWFGWKPIRESLEKVEAAAPPPPPPPKEEEQPKAKTAQPAQVNPNAPTFILTGGGNTITEGGSSTFHINKLSGTMTGPVTVSISITEDSGNNDFLASNTMTVSVPISGTASFTVNTVQDSINDPDSALVIVSLASGIGYNINSTLHSATFTVKDDDAVTTTNPPKTVNPSNYCDYTTYAGPNYCVRLQLTSGLSSIEEGETITLMAYSDAPVLNVNGLTINIAIADKNGYINGTLPTTITIPNTKSRAELTLTTEDDNIDENDGVITISISPGAGYLLSDGGRDEVEVNVQDNDTGPPPVITISSLGDITEGSQARFNVVATPTPKDAVPIYYTVSRTGDFDNYGNQVYLKAITKYDTVLSLDTVNDTTDEPDGSITVTLQQTDENGNDWSAYYILSSNTASTVAVKDNDLPESNKKNIAACVTNAMKDRVRFYISEIRRGNAHVLKWKEVLHVLNGHAGEAQIEKVKVSAKNQMNRGWSRWDEIYEALLCMQGAKTTPVLTIESDGNTVTEGASASITLTSTLPFGSNTDVKLHVSGDFVADGNQICTFAASSHTPQTCTIAMNADNGNVDPDGTFQVTIKDGAGYKVGSEKTVNIEVSDSSTPAMTIAADSNIIEGATGTFTITSSDSTITSSVQVKVMDGGNFITSGQGGLRTVTVSGGTGTLSVNTDDDSVAEDASFVTVTILEGTGYRVGTSNQVQLTVSDNDGGSNVAVNGRYVECDPGDTTGKSCTFIESASFTDQECAAAPVVNVNKYTLPSTSTIESGAYNLNQIRGVGKTTNYGKRPTGSPHFPNNNTKYRAEFVYPDGKNYFSEDEDVTVRFWVSNYNPKYPNRDDNYQQPTAGYLCSKDKNTNIVKKDSRWVNDWKHGPDGAQAPANQPTDYASTYENGPDAITKVYTFPKNDLITFTGGYGVPMNQNRIAFRISSDNPGVVRTGGLHDVHFGPGGLYVDYKFKVGANCRRTGETVDSNHITNFNSGYDDGNKYFRHNRAYPNTVNNFKDPLGVHISDQRNYSCESGEPYGTPCTSDLSGFSTPLYCMKPTDTVKLTLNSFGVSGRGGSWDGSSKITATIRPKATGENAFVVEGFVRKITEGHPLNYFITTHDGKEPKQGGTLHLKAITVSGGAPFENDENTKVIDIPITIGNGWFTRAAPYNGGRLFQNFFTEDDGQNEGDSVVRLEVAEGNEFPIRFANGESYIEYTVLDNEVVTLNTTLIDNGISETSGTATLTVKLPEGTIEGDDADMILDIIPAPFTNFHNYIDWTDPSGNGDKRQTAIIKAAGCTGGTVAATEAKPYFRCIIEASTASQTVNFTFRALPQGDELDDQNPGHIYDLGFYLGHYQETQSLQPQFEITGTRDEYKSLDNVLTVTGRTDFTGDNAIKVASVAGIHGDTGMDTIVMGVFKGNYNNGNIPGDATPISNPTFVEPSSNDASLLGNDVLYVAFKRISSDPEQSKGGSTTFDVAFNHGTATPGKDFRVYSWDPKQYCKGSATFNTNAQGHVVPTCDGEWSTDTRNWHSYDYGQGVRNVNGDRVTLGDTLNEWQMGFKLVPMRDSVADDGETVIGKFARKSMSSAKGVYHAFYTTLKGQVNATLQNTGAETLQVINNVQVTIPDVTAPEGATPTKFTMTVVFPSNQNGCLESKMEADALWAYPGFLMDNPGGKLHEGRLKDYGDFLIGNNATDKGMRNDYHFADTRFKMCSTNTKKTFTRDFYVYAHADGVDDNGETATLQLQAPRYTSGGKKYNNKVAVTKGTLTVTNDGPLPKEWIARFGHVIASETVEAVSDRVRAERKPGSSELSFGATPTEEFSITEGSEIIKGSSFNLTSEERDGNTLSAWGKVSTSSFDASITNMDLDSDNTHAMMGIDYSNGLWMLGVGLGFHDGKGGAEMLTPFLEYDIESKLTNVFPYGSITMGNTKVWSTVGYGTGEITIKQNVKENGKDVKNDLGTADTEWWMGAVGFRSALFDTKHYSMAIVGDAFWTAIESGKAVGYNAAEADSHRERLGLEASMEFDRLSFTPSVFARTDGGDVGNETGIEVNASVSWEPLNGLFLTGAGSHVLDSENEFKTYSLGAEWQTKFGSPSVSYSEDGNYSIGWSKQFNGGMLGINTIPNEQSTTLDLSVRF